MSLLNLGEWWSVRGRVRTLHSTMSLLNLFLLLLHSSQQLSLHSTMSLLNHFLCKNIYYVYFFFTFHNVSIKSMFDDEYIDFNFDFTFHNVSIKSARSGSRRQRGISFTFHNVSIKSQSWRSSRQNMKVLYVSIKSKNGDRHPDPHNLYIPQCLY